MSRRTFSLPDSFIDIALICIGGLALMFVAAVLRMNPENKIPPAVETRGKFLVIIQWPDGSADDVDLYVKDPEGHVVFFQNRDTGLMHLEHDDLGSRSDIVTSATGQEIKIDRNEERTVLRGTIPGEYVVNVHMYAKNDPNPTKVTVILYQLIGSDKELTRKERILLQSGDEKTAFRFTVTEAETVRGINELPFTIVRAAHGPDGRILR